MSFFVSVTSRVCAYCLVYSIVDNQLQIEAAGVHISSASRIASDHLPIWARLAGLALSIGLIVAGMRLPDKALRLAGLVLLTATIVKVFLVDASELEGVWRILSFLGLGVALIGIGRLYGPVLRAERPGAGQGSGP